MALLGVLGSVLAEALSDHEPSFKAALTGTVTAALALTAARLLLS